MFGGKISNFKSSIRSAKPRGFAENVPFLICITFGETLKAAIVADLAGKKGERFQELIVECNRGQQINFFDDVAQAEWWLTT